MQEGNHERLDKEPLRDIAKLYAELVCVLGACKSLSPRTLSPGVHAPASTGPFLIRARNLYEWVDHVLAKVLKALDVVERDAAHQVVPGSRRVARSALARERCARIDGLQVGELVEESLQQEQGERLLGDLELDSLPP